MIYKYIGRHQMNRRSYLCLYVYDNSKEFKIGIAGFSIYGTKSEKLRFYLGSSSQNFFSPPKLKMPPRALIDYLILPFFFVLAGSLHEFLCVFLWGLDVPKSSTPSKNGSLCYVGDEGQNRSQTKRY